MSLEWLEWLSVERLVAAAAVGQLAVLAYAARYARNQVAEARELRKEQARPFVVVDFEPEEPPFVNLVITNLGRTMARNVRIEVDPPFDSSVYRSDPVPLAKLKLFTEGIPALAPGKRIVLLFDQMIHREELDLPLTYGVRLTYEWDGGDPLSDELRLDLDLYRPLRQVRRHTVHDVSKTLDAIHRQFEKWTAGGGGLLVLSPEDRRRRNREIMSELEERHAAERTAENGRLRMVGRLLEVVGRLRPGPPLS